MVFAGSALAWLAKLKALLDVGQRSTEGLRHSELVVQHQLVEYLPSGVLLQAKMGRLRSVSSRVGGSSGDMFTTMSESLQMAAAVAFPGSAKAFSDGGSLITIAASGHAQTAFQQYYFEDGVMVVLQELWAIICDVCKGVPNSSWPHLASGVGVARPPRCGD